MVRDGEHINPQEGFKFVSAHRAEHTVKMMCHILKLSRGGYYKWLKRAESKRALEDQALIDDILRSHLKVKGDMEC